MLFWNKLVLNEVLDFVIRFNNKKKKVEDIMRFEEIEEVKPYLEKGKVWKHISIGEYNCHHCGKFPIVYDKKHMDAILYLFNLFEDIRIRWGEAIRITSGYRCKEYQKMLKKIGKKAATYSPHNYGIALDIQPFNPTEKRVKQLYDLILQVEPEIRMGAVKYDWKFIHIDVAYKLPITKLVRKGLLPSWVNQYWKPGVRW